jgi:hypothetical protein
VSMDDRVERILPWKSPSKSLSQYSEQELEQFVTERRISIWHFIKNK